MKTHKKDLFNDNGMKKSKQNSDILDDYTGLYDPLLTFSTSICVCRMAFLGRKFSCSSTLPILVSSSKLIISPVVFWRENSRSVQKVCHFRFRGCLNCGYFPLDLLLVSVWSTSAWVSPSAKLIQYMKCFKNTKHRCWGMFFQGG